MFRNMFRMLVAVALAAVWVPLALAGGFAEGTDYQRIADPVPTRNPAKIEVVEVFAYTCPHCFRFEPMIQRWEKTLAPDVYFRPSPIVWDDLAQFHAQMFYTAKALWKLNVLHDRFFHAIHIDHNMLNTPDKVYALFAAVGVTRPQFDKVFNSDAISERVRQAKARALAYGITGTPEMVVDGKYRVSGSFPGMNLDEQQAHARMLQVVDYLIDKERKTRASTK